MNEDALRAMVREAVARRLGASDDVADAGRRRSLGLASHISH